MDELEPKDILETGLKTLFGPVSDLFLKLTGPTAEEYGLMWAESVRVRRTKRLVNGLAKTKRLVEAAGFEPRTVPDKLLLPIFNGMSVEEDEDLQTMWAALLANAASPENPGRVNPGFAAILTKMSRDEAVLMNWIYDAVEGSVNHKAITFGEAYEAVSIGTEHLAASFNALEAEQLVHDEQAPSAHPQKGLGKTFSVTTGPSEYSLTNRGYFFVTACQPPKPKS